MENQKYLEKFIESVQGKSCFVFMPFKFTLSISGEYRDKFIYSTFRNINHYDEVKCKIYTLATNLITHNSSICYDEQSVNKLNSSSELKNSITQECLPLIITQKRSNLPSIDRNQTKIKNIHFSHDTPLTNIYFCVEYELISDEHICLSISMINDGYIVMFYILNDRDKQQVKQLIVNNNMTINFKEFIKDSY